MLSLIKVRVLLNLHFTHHQSSQSLILKFALCVDLSMPRGLVVLDIGTLDALMVCELSIFLMHVIHYFFPRSNSLIACT